MLDELGDENKSINMTDPDAAVMQHKDKRKLPSYNHQSAVDGKYGITCAVSTRCENDQPKDLFALVDEARKNTGAAHQNGKYNGPPRRRVVPTELVNRGFVKRIEKE